MPSKEVQAALTENINAEQKLLQQENALRMRFEEGVKELSIALKAVEGMPDEISNEWLEGVIANEQPKDVLNAAAICVINTAINQPNAEEKVITSLALCLKTKYPTLEKLGNTPEILTFIGMTESGTSGVVGTYEINHLGNAYNPREDSYMLLSGIHISPEDGVETYKPFSRYGQLQGFSEREFVTVWPGKNIAKYLRTTKLLPDSDKGLLPDGHIADELQSAVNFIEIIPELLKGGKITFMPNQNGIVPKDSMPYRIAKNLQTLSSGTAVSINLNLSEFVR